MKKLMMIAAMMVATLSASAQFEPGTFTLQPKVGVDLAKLSGGDGKFKFGLAAGIEGQYQINDWFGVAAAVMYQQEGTKVKDFDDLKLKTEYINVPIVAKFYVTKGLSLNAGLQPGFMTKAKTTGKLLGESVDEDIKSTCNKVDLSIPLGVAYELPMGLTFDFRYNIGLTKVGKEPKDKDFDDGGNYDAKNQVLMLTVGYKFSL